MSGSARHMILSCSPRKGGNSDFAADVFAGAMARDGAACEIIRLRDYTVRPCLSCGHCAKDPQGRCALEGGDQARELFSRLMAAPSLFLSAPIYFYHLPAQLKALVDRSQSFYVRRQKGDPVLAALSERTARVCLVAGRPAGDELFRGSLLTLKYFLRSFNLVLADPLTLRGLDGPGELAGDSSAVAALEAMGREAAQR